MGVGLPISVPTPVAGEETTGGGGATGVPVGADGRTGEVITLVGAAVGGETVGCGCGAGGDVGLIDPAAGPLQHVGAVGLGFCGCAGVAGGTLGPWLIGELRVFDGAVPDVPITGLEDEPLCG